MAPTINVAKLKRRAEAARDGNIAKNTGDQTMSAVEFDFIAECDPTTILALIERSIPELPPGYILLHLKECLNGGFEAKITNVQQSHRITGPTPRAAVEAAIARIGAGA